MNEERNELGALIKSGYRALFIEQWPSLAGGVAVGILSVLCFTWDRPWGVVGGLRVWGDWLFYAVGLYDQAPASAWTDTNSLITLGLLWGALAASMLSGQFALRMPPGLEMVKGLVGGTLLGVGAALAGGCNVGGFYSSVSALSLSGFAMMAGLLAGAWVGLKYLYWEMEHLTAGPAPTLPSLGDWSRVKPWLGWILILGGLAFFYLYQTQGYVIQGGVTLFGMAFGFTLVRSRLCFARAFREPFMTGEAKITQVVIISLMISVAGFAILKWGGLRSEISYVAPNFGLGGLVGGFIFGIGMLVTGGCGSGTAWRAAEGQIKLMAALVLFALTNSLTKAAIKTSPEIQSLVGFRVFLPDWLGYQWTVVAIFLVLAVWYVAASWNERTGSMVIEM